jgi:hypothetical protein
MLRRGMADVSRDESRIGAEEQSTDALSSARVSLPVLLAVAALVLLLPAALRFGPLAASARASQSPFRADIERIRPRMVFLGNSMLASRIDPDVLDRRLGPGSAYVIATWGQMSAYWYLVTKNHIAAAAHPPEKLFLFFRDHHLTEPTLRTTGKYLRELRKVSRAQEPEFEAVLASRQTWQERLADLLRDIYPIQQRRDGASNRLQALAALPLGAAGPSWDVGRRYNELFDLERLRPTEGDDLGGEARYPGAYDFADNVERSFLPRIIELCRARGIQLHLVRVQRRPGPDGPPPQSPELRAYLEALRAYLAAQGVAYHDFTGDPEVTLARYRDGDHIADPAWYTELFLERLASELR